MPTPKRVQTAGKWAWRVELRPGGRKGKHTSRTFATKPKAIQFCKLVDALGPSAALAHHDAETARETGPTLDEVVEHFWEWKLTGPRKVRSSRTVDDYRRDYRLWIGPVFGARPAHSVTEAEVQMWVDKMLAGALLEDKGPLDPKTVVDRHALLHQVYAWLVRPAQRQRWGVEHNPCADQDLPSRTRKPPKGMRPAEWQALWAQLVDKRDAAEFALFLLSTGWRFSAAAALSAHDVEDYWDPDTREGDMFVTQGFVWRREGGTMVRVEDTKGEGSRGRRIRVDEVMAAVIRRRLDRIEGDGLVFTTPQGHQWHNNNFRDRYWDPAVEAAGLERKPTPHWLRHSQAGWMLLSGKASITEVQRRIGHRHSNTTVDSYGRLVEDVPVAALEAFVEMRGPVSLDGLGLPGAQAAGELAEPRQLR